jgi:hypothetical protein
MRFHLPVGIFSTRNMLKLTINSKSDSWIGEFNRCQRELYIRIESVIWSTGWLIFSCWVCVTPVSTNSSATKFNKVR